ncbi:MAG: hypothetical protein M1497_08695 [Nitrospirae bacterium]|nr:hypothetical protein [Nitrospirota bacterium]
MAKIMITACIVALAMLFDAAGVVAENKIYSNKDLEKYIKTKGMEAPAGKEAPIKFMGKKVTLDFSDANLTSVLSLIADIARKDGYTVTVDPKIQGKITLKMTNVPWNQALDFFVESHGLAKTVKDKMIMIVPGK